MWIKVSQSHTTVLQEILSSQRYREVVLLQARSINAGMLCKFKQKENVIICKRTTYIPTMDLQSTPSLSRMALSCSSMILWPVTSEPFYLFNVPDGYLFYFTASEFFFFTFLLGLSVFKLLLKKYLPLFVLISVVLRFAKPCGAEGRLRLGAKNLFHMHWISWCWYVQP